MEMRLVALPTKSVRRCWARGVCYSSAWRLLPELARRAIVCRARLKLTYIGGTFLNNTSCVSCYVSSSGSHRSATEHVFVQYCPVLRQNRMVNEPKSKSLDLLLQWKLGIESISCEKLRSEFEAMIALNDS
jgi:hypothetical protein